MKIYILSVSEIGKTPDITFSSYVAPRMTKKTEYFASKDLAETRSKEIYEGIYKLVGSIDNIEVSIREQEVKE